MTFAMLYLNIDSQYFANPTTAKLTSVNPTDYLKIQIGGVYLSYFYYTNEQLIKRIEELEELVIDLEEQNSILKELSALDGLTKICNQRTLVNCLKTQVNDATKAKKPLCIAMFDIDNFKRVNDTMGHIYGNRVLYQLAETIQKHTRELDLVGRYGGDEFMVIFTDTDIVLARNIAERIRQAVQDAVFIDGLQVTISGGVKQYAGENFIDLIHFADLNLYKAKKLGKNKIV